jgi:hypothetical protein
MLRQCSVEASACRTHCQHGRRHAVEAFPERWTRTLRIDPKTSSIRWIVGGLLLLSGWAFFCFHDQKVQGGLADQILDKYKVAPETIWWKHHTERLSRIYQPRFNFSWCIPETTVTHDWHLNSKNEAEGLIYIKLYKASSSTCEGVSLSIAHNVARRLTQRENSPPCIHYNRHVFQDVGGLAYKSPTSSATLVWTMVRNPIERDLSSFYFFDVSRQNATVSDHTMLETFRLTKNFQTSYLLPWYTVPWSAGSEFSGKRDELVRWLENDIMPAYDFIGVAERFDESLAVMVILWNLEVTDVIVMSAKQSGGYDDAGETGQCTKIVKPLPPSPAIKNYWSTEHAVDNVDFLLWDVAYRSLDRTIDRIGRDRVKVLVEEIQNLRELAQYWCSHKTHFPCNARGIKQFHLSKKSCYVQDAGCGHACVDKTMDRYRRGELHFLSEEEKLMGS